MSKHLQFRRLYGEFLELRQLFAADLHHRHDESLNWHMNSDQPWQAEYDQVAQLEYSHSTECLRNQTLDEAASGVDQLSSKRGPDRARVDFPSRGSGRMTGEGEFGVAQDFRAQQRSNNAPLERELLPTTSPSQATQIGSGGVSVSPSISQTQIVPGLKSTSRESNSLSPTNTANASNNRANAESSTIVITFRIAQPDSGIIVRPASNSVASQLPASLPSRTTPTLGSSDSSASGRHTALTTIQSIQQQQTNTIRSLQNIAGITTETARHNPSGLMIQNSEIRTNELNQHRNFGSATSQQSNRVTGLDQAKSNRPSGDLSLFENSLTKDRLGTSDRPWKISDQAIKNLRNLSKAVTSSDVEDSSATDIAIASWFEEGGLTTIDIRRTPILRPDQPWTVAQTTTRLESRIGMYRVFDVIEDRDFRQLEMSAEQTEGDRSTFVQSGIAANDMIAPIVSAQSSEVESTQYKWMHRPLFLTTLLAVLSNRLFHSRRKKVNNSGQDIPSEHH